MDHSAHLDYFAALPLEERRRFIQQLTSKVSRRRDADLYSSLFLKRKQSLPCAPAIRIGDKAAKARSSREVVVDVRKDFEDLRDNQLARKQARAHAQRAVRELRAGADILIKCASGLVRSLFVAQMVREEFEEDLDFEDVDTDLRQSRPLWFDPAFQLP
jgi:hypothetical protein